MRLPLPADIDSRDGITNADSRMLNMLAEQDTQGIIVSVRPGLTRNATNGASNGQGLVCFNNVLVAIQSGLLYKPSSGSFGGSTSLPSASVSAQFDFAQSPA